ncbi:MAG: hypothetical protein IV085_11135 [Thiobacillus sp.]|nr:hypothetical protein [Thiobacillus sp.]
MLTRRLLPWIFALTLLFGQAAAFAHALAHLHVDDKALPDKVCELCVAQAQLGSAVPPAAVILVAPRTLALQPDRVATLCVDLAPFPACARAPPAPLDI